MKHQLSYTVPFAGGGVSTSLGGVLVREGRLDEALAAYSRALGRAPRDEAALSGRAEALLAAGRPAEAAEILERLADVQAKTDRRPEALVTLRRAEALESSRARRRRIKELEAIDAPLRPVRTRLTSRLPRPRARPVAVAPAAAEAGEAAADEVIAPGAPPDPETLLASANALLDDDPWYTGLGQHAQARQQAYRAWVDAAMRADEWTHIRQATQQGRVIGTEQFQREIEAMLGRRLGGAARGRPRKDRAVKQK
jgi:tetratricopeptide (TPR) repeat protein